MRAAGLLLVLLCLPTACGSGGHPSAFRVTLTAQNHHPRVTLTGRNRQPPPSEQWGYCVKVRTAAGKSVASTIHLQIVSGRTMLERVGLVSLKQGYDRWCGSIGGEYNVLEALPRGKKLDFQAVVQAEGVTVKRDWPIVVR